MKNLRVLVFSATFGAGHVRAADAVIEAIRLKEPAAEITHLDCGGFLNKKFNSVVKSTYLGMIKRTPKLWGKFYYGTSKISPDSAIQRFLNRMGRKDFKKYIQSLNPDLIVCTYPTVAGVLSELKLNKEIDVPLVTVITDFVVHSQWIHQGVDLYIVGCKEVFKGLVSRGIEPERIKVTGIPVSPRFERSLNRTEIAAKLGLDPNLPTLLIMGGAYGVLEGAKETCRIFADLDYPLQSVVVCGHDEKIYKSLADVIEKARNHMVHFGYVDNVEELMTAADIIITKAGGLTVSEALTKRLPLVIFKPIPGQEQENTIFLGRIGAGLVAGNQLELENIVRFLLEHPEELAKMRQAAARALPGRAAERAVGHMFNLIGEAQNEVKIG